MEDNVKVTYDSFSLIFLDNSLVISDFQYSQSDACNGNPYNTAFKIKIVSGPFSGLGDCEYDIKNFILFAREINELYDFQRNKVELSEICYGSNVSFEMNKTGHLAIRGEIFGRAMLHTLKFEFDADQTALKPFADSLRQLYTII